MPAQVWAQSLYWDGDAGPKNNNVVDGGSGTWQKAGTLNNWTDSTGATNTPWSDGGFAIFSVPSGIVIADNSNGVVTASGMQFASNGYVIAGDMLTLVGSIATPGQSIIRVGDGTGASVTMTAIISANLTGTAQLMKTDLGALVLSGINTYTGGTDIQDGTLQVATGRTNSQDSLSTGSVSINADATLLANTFGNFSFDNALTGTGTLSASSSNLAFSFGAGVGNAFAGTVALSNNTFLLGGDNTTALTSAALVLGAGNITTVGSGNQQIGGLTFNGSDIIFNAAAPAQKVAASLITVSTLDVSGNGTVQINLPDPYTLSTPTPTGELSLFAQSHVNDGLQLVAATGVTGTGANLTLKDQSGNAISSAQSIDIQQSGNLVAIGTYNYMLETGASNDGLYVGYNLSALALQAGQSLTLTENTGATGNDIDLATALTGSGNLVLAANNVVSLSNPTNTFTGTTLVQSGTLQANAANVIALSSAVNVEGSFDTNGYNQSVNNLTSGNAGSQILLSGANTLTLDGGATPNTFAGVISGNGSLVQASGTEILTGANTYTGGTTINGGTLEVSGSLGNNTSNITNNATLNIAGMVTGDVVTNNTGATITNKGTITCNTLTNGGTIYNYGTISCNVTGNPPINMHKNTAVIPSLGANGLLTLVMLMLLMGGIGFVQRKRG